MQRGFQKAPGETRHRNLGVHPNELLAMINLCVCVRESIKGDALNFLVKHFILFLY